MQFKLIVAVLALLATACSSATAPAASPTATSTAIAESTRTPFPSATGTPIELASATPAPSATTAVQPTSAPTSTIRPTSTPVPTLAQRCGVERWAVKTLSDRDAGRVNFVPVPTTVRDLRSLSAPRTLPAASRIAPTELTVYTLTARIVAAKVEDDRDFHVVVADLQDASLTMIIEFPDALACSGAVDSSRVTDLRNARKAFVAAFGEPPSSRFAELNGTATFTGVGFFDSLHGQRGVAPNGIELHPVLSFTR